MVETDIKRMLKDIEELGEKGQIEEAERLTDEVERLRKAKDDLLLIAVNPTLASKQMKICEVCGAMQSINELEKRNVTHLEGKLHMGFDLLRRQLEILKKRLESVNLSIEVKKEEMINEGRDPERDVSLVETLKHRKGKVADRNIDFTRRDSSDEEDTNNQKNRYPERDRNNRDGNSNFRRDFNRDNRNIGFRDRPRQDFRDNYRNDSFRGNKFDDRDRNKNRDDWRDNKDNRDNRDKERRFKDDYNRDRPRRDDVEKAGREFQNNRRDRDEYKRDDRDRNYERKDRHDRYDKEDKPRRSERDGEYTDRHRKIAKKEKRRRDSSDSN